MALTEIMKEKNITSQDLSVMTGIAKKTIDAYRMGSREPSLSNGLKMADALRVDPHKLLPEQRVKNTEQPEPCPIGNRWGTWFEAEAERTLESVNAAFFEKTGENGYGSMEEIEKAEKEGFLEFEGGMMTVHVLMN